MIGHGTESGSPAPSRTGAHHARRPSVTGGRTTNIGPSDGVRAATVATLRRAGCVFAEAEAELLLAAASSPAELAGLVEQRAAGLPLEHLVGWAEFAGLRIAVGPGVFVPRRRTEFLVDQAAALAQPGAVVVDLCCGSGALGVALAARVDGIELFAADVDPTAVAWARRNVEPFGGRAYVGDLFTALPPALARRIEVLLANVPYVPTAAIALLPPEARVYEPAVSLDGGMDGLDVLRRVAPVVGHWLAPGGSVLVEVSADQAPAAAVILAEPGLAVRVVTAQDGEATVVLATLAGRRPHLRPGLPPSTPARGGDDDGRRRAAPAVRSAGLRLRRTRERNRRQWRTWPARRR